MKKIYALFLFLFLVSLGLLPAAQAQTGPNTGTLADISFITGHWKANTGDRTVEGHWFAPDGNNMTGTFRMMKDGKVTMYEILAYEKSDQGLVSLVKHFNPGLIAVEEKEVSDRYHFVEASKGRAIFQKSDGSLRILYEKKSDNQFVIARGTMQEGKWVFKNLFEFTRVK
jgi:Domain of unknown function (DUF6265)